MVSLIPIRSARQAMVAEANLSGRINVKLTAPPVHLRRGCDLALSVEESDLIEAMRLLEELDIEFVDPVYESDPQHVLELTTMTRIGDYVMIRAGNMKLTFDPDTGEIVNVSGGGCPDVPFLASSIIGQMLGTDPDPREEGYTLCAYLLARAYNRALEIWGVK